MRDLHRAYVAGLFDGEGSVIAKMGSTTRDQFSCRISIAQKNPVVLYAVKRTLGYGQVHETNIGTFFYKVDSAPQVMEFIRFVYPYSVVKREQLRLGYKLAKLVGKFDEKAHASRRELGFQIRSLNVEKRRRILRSTKAA